jgi:hypothetical protein
MTFVASSVILVSWIYLSTSHKKFCGFSLSFPLNTDGAGVVAIDGSCTWTGMGDGAMLVFKGVRSLLALGTMN